MQLTNYYWWRHSSKKRLAYLNEEEATMEAAVRRNLYPLGDARTLIDTWELLQRGRCFHRDILLISTSFQWALLQTLQVSSVAGGLVAFCLIPVGWAQASTWLHTLFLSLSAVVAYCGIATRLLRHDQNIRLNLERYQSYRLLQLQLYHYVVSYHEPPEVGAGVGAGVGDDLGGASPENPFPVLPKVFLRALHSRLLQIPITLFDLDPSQIRNPSELATMFSPKR